VPWFGDKPQQRLSSLFDSELGFCPQQEPLFCPIMSNDLIPRRRKKDDYLIFSGTIAVGRIYRLPSIGTERWWWGIFIEHRYGPAPWSALTDTFEDAKAAFRQAWDAGQDFRQHGPR